MLLSNYNLKSDVLVFKPSNETLGVFENSGVATGWTIEIPPAANDLNYDTITDIKLILYFTARYDSIIADIVRAKLPKTDTRSAVYPIRFLFPDEFFHFKDTGELNFSIGPEDFPYHQIDQVLKNFAIRITTESGTTPANIQLQVSTGAHPGEVGVITGPDGTVKSENTDPANSLNVFLESKAADDWHVEIAPTENPELNLKQINDVFLFIEYEFKYRGM